MSKGFEYRKSGKVTLEEAKRARRNIFLVRGLGWVALAAAYVGMYITAPSWVTVTVTVVGAIFCFALFMDAYGSKIANWWKTQKVYYLSAKQFGVKDE